MKLPYLIPLTVLLLSPLVAFAQKLPEKPIIFIRHGTTSWKPEHKCPQPPGLPISQEGIRQSEAAGQYLASHPTKAERITSSSVTRAEQTAKIIDNYLKLPIVICDGLNERGSYKWEDKSTTLMAQNSTLKKAADFDCENAWPKHEESMEAFTSRMRETFQKLLSEDGPCLLVVSHGGAFKFLCEELLGEKRFIGNANIAYFTPPLASESNSKWHMELIIPYDDKPVAPYRK